MKMLKTLTALSVVLLAASPAAQAHGPRVGVVIGAPIFGPYWAPGYYPYYPRYSPYYYPPPVIIERPVPQVYVEQPATPAAPAAPAVPPAPPAPSSAPGPSVSAPTTM